MVDAWKQSTLGQLKTRNFIGSSFQEIIDTNNALILTEKQLRAHLERANQTNKILSDRCEDLEDKSKQNAVHHHDGLVEQLMQKAENVQLLLDTQTKLKETEETCKLLRQENESSRLNADTLSRQMEERERTSKLLKEELVNLQVELLKTEEQVKKLKKENKGLCDRLMKKVEEEVERMNEATKLFNELNESTHKPQPQLTTSTATLGTSPQSILDGTKSLFGTTVVPRGVRKRVEAHQGEINAIAFSQANGGALFATGGMDKVVKIWDTYTCTQKVQLSGAEKTVMCLQFSSNDEMIMAGSNDNAIRIWSVGLGRLRHSFLGHVGKVYTTEFTYDNQRVVSGSHDRSLKIWDIQRGYCMRTLFCFSSCNHLSLSRDSAVAASGHLDCALRFWDVKTGEMVHQLPSAHTGQVTSVSCSPDGRVILSAARDNTLKLTDIRTYEPLKTMTDPDFKTGVNWTRACFSPDGRYVSAGSMDGTVYVWDTTTGQVATKLKAQHKQIIPCVAWNPNGFHLASGDRHGLVVLWG